MTARLDSFFTDQITDMTDSMFRVSYVLLRNTADCEDAIQTAILQAYEHLPALRDRTRFRAWCMRILKHACYDLLRRRRDTLPLDERLAADALPAENIDLYRAMTRLRADSRVVLVLYYSERYTQKEIAHILDIPPGTVASRLSRARNELRNLMTEEPTA